MAFNRATVIGASGDDFIDVLADGYIWDLPPEGTLSWAVADGLNGEVWPDRDAAVATFGAAIDAFAPFIDVDFQFVGAFDDPIAAGAVGADIVYSLDSLTVDEFTLAYAYYPGPEDFTWFEQYETEGGDIFLNLSNEIIADSSFRLGSEGFLTVIHEVGHALGLKHPFDASPWRPTLDDLDQSVVRDLDWFTIMSYSDQYENQFERWDPATPMVLDVLALQYLYGANPSTNAGDTVLSLETQRYYYTIWDAGGTDRVDASQQSKGWTIELPDFQVSSLVDTLAGFALPSDQLDVGLVDSAPRELVWLMGDIEHATGSRFADTIVGNRFDNDLRGGAGDDILEGYRGNDTLDGNAGQDTAVFFGEQSSFTLTIGPDVIRVADRRSDGFGTDTLRDIEEVMFYTETGSQSLDLGTFGGAGALTEAELEAVIELYIAYFNRAPDAIGLNYWGTAFANGVSLPDMAEFFIDQDETRATFESDVSNREFATLVYQNVLGRAPDADGLDFWVQALDSGGVSKAQFILEVLGGARAVPAPDATREFVDQQRADQNYLATKTDLGALFAVHRGMSDVNWARDAMALFDGSEDSTASVIDAIDGFYAQALDPGTGAFLMPIVGILDTVFEPIA